MVYKCTIPITEGMKTLGFIPELQLDHSRKDGQMTFCLLTSIYVDVEPCLGSHYPMGPSFFMGNKASAWASSTACILLFKSRSVLSARSSLEFIHTLLSFCSFWHHFCATQHRYSALLGPIIY